MASQGRLEPLDQYFLISLWESASAGTFDDEELLSFAEREQLDESTVRVLLLWAQRNGYIEPMPYNGANLSRWWSFSSKGMDEVQRLQELGNDRRAHLRHTADALLQWTFENPSGSPTRFRKDNRSYFAGRAIDSAMLDMAARYLIDRGALEVESVGWRVTAAGIDCLFSGGSVSDFFNREQATGGDVYHVHQPQGGNVIGGRHNNVSQNNHFGMPVELLAQLLRFAAQVKQIAPVLGLPDDEQQQLVGQAQDLADEVAAPTPEPGRVRQALETLRGEIAGATPLTAAATLLAAEADKLGHAVARPF